MKKELFTDLQLTCTDSIYEILEETARAVSEADPGNSLLHAVVLLQVMDLESDDHPPVWRFILGQRDPLLRLGVEFLDYTMHCDGLKQLDCKHESCDIIHAVQTSEDITEIDKLSNFEITGSGIIHKPDDEEDDEVETKPE